MAHPNPDVKRSTLVTGEYLRQNQGMRSRADTIWLEAQAKEIGFDLCGVVAAEQFPELARSEEWLAKGFAGEMKYLEDPRRSDAARAMPGIRSVIVCALNYSAPFPYSKEFVGARGSFASRQLAVRSDSRPEPGVGDTPSRQQQAEGDPPRGWISRYAWGSDYHDVLRERLEQLVEAMHHRFSSVAENSSHEDFEARVYSDTGPIQERIFAKYAGLGWLGKNTLLLNQRLGSWFFLGAILTTLELAPSLEGGASPPPDLCGTCRKCLDACPTQAFPEPYVMDARRCIAYLTIELRGAIPEEFRESMGMHVFGCDICQDVCPWNRRAPATWLAEFQPRTFPTRKTESAETHAPGATHSTHNVPSSDEPAEEQSSNEESLFLPRLEWLASLSESEFREKFRGSAIKRTKWRGLVRNACIAIGNAGVRRGTGAHERISELLQRLSRSQDGLVAESALWALRRIE